MEIGVVSLGCPKNLVDSEVMMGLIRERQWTITNDPTHADVIIVNTCGFIESAKTESINTILQMAEYKKDDPHRKLIVTGCLGQRYADELFADLPEVDAIIGTECYDQIGTVIDRVEKGERFTLLKPPAKIYPEGQTGADHPPVHGLSEDCRRMQQPVFLLCHPQDPGALPKPSL